MKTQGADMPLDKPNQPELFIYSVVFSRRVCDPRRKYNGREKSSEIM